MCQDVAVIFNTAHPNGKGIRIAGLYGMPGQGKTTLGKTFCNLNLKEFCNRVCHLKFCGGNKLDRQKLALEYLTHCSKSQLESLTREEEARQKLYERVRGQRVLLVLDNITEDSIDEVKYYLGADLGENSCILLSARSEDVLAKNFSINLNSSMSIPALEEKEAIAILLERTSLESSTLGTDDRRFALKRAKKCSFNFRRARTFHPMALKAFGGYLFSKYGSDLSTWAAEIDGMVDRAGDGLDEVFVVLKKAFDYMNPKYRTIFMLLTLYMQPNMPPLKVNEWLAITCKEEIEYIENAVKALLEKAFIEEIKPEIRIQNVYLEFALSQARKMKRWLWYKDDLVTSEAEEGLELANVEYYQHLDLSKIGTECVKNLWALQVVDGKKEMCNLGISLMKYIRNFTSHNSEYLVVLGGMENLPYLASIQVGKLPELKVLNLSSLNALQYLEIMGHVPLIADCSSLSKIVLNRCDPVTEYSDEDKPNVLELCISSEDALAPRHPECCDGLKNLPLWNIVISSDVPSLRRLSNLTLLKLYNCDISEPPDVTCCSMLEDVYFFRLRYLKSFPKFSSLGKLKKLCLSNCKRVRAPPAIGGCQGLQVFNFLHNDNMEELPQMNGFSLLQEIKLSWQLEDDPESCSDEDDVLDDSNSYEDDNLEICPDYDEIFRNLNDVFMPVELKRWHWIQDKTVRVQKYSRGGKEYYCMIASYV
ncbi:disease resistance protein RRS1B [Cryptomeria japonica]|uniref:disease resistance protein RRS1B n=1 Tax=Cryptomeria japonica TaxID=3369 RepID=UPI0027DA2604|nr:disease resistance protein RRS1B [Cryptomeria japonica]